MQTLDGVGSVQQGYEIADSISEAKSDLFRCDQPLRPQ